MKVFTRSLVGLRAPRIPGFGEQAAAHWLALLCVGQVVLWGFAFGLAYSAPEIDSAEQFVWSFSLESGYWKHPPLPSWLMHFLLAAFGPSVVLPFAATQCCVVIALALVWRLGCEWMPPSRALVAVALTSLVAYHNVGADNFNHSTALLPFQAATFLAFHRATRRASLAWWVATGACAALAVLVKYVAVLPVLGLLIYLLLDRALHTGRQLLGLALSLATFATVLLPHALWLDATHYLPFHYARSVTQSIPGLAATFLHLGDFLAMQGVRVAPFVAAACYVLWHGSARLRVAGAAPMVVSGSTGEMPSRTPNERLFLWIAAVAPLAFTVLIALLTQTALQSRWGSNSFLLVGLLLMTLARQPTDEATVRRALHATLVVQLVLCVGMTLTKTIVAERLAIRTRANFPGAALAQFAHSTWSTEVPGAPLRVVVSDIWLGGNIVAHGKSADRVAVLIDGHRFKSPWVKPGAIRACGALVLDDITDDRAGHGAPNPVLDELFSRADVTGVWSIPWSRPELHPPDATRGQVRWGVIRPRDPAACKLR